jgi:hypothetical protein
VKVPPTLRRFQLSDAFVRCVVGPVGSGKSSVCIIEILRRAAKQKPGPDGVRRTRWAIIRNTYGQLRDTTRKTFEEWVPHWLGTWNEQSFTWTGEWVDDEGPDAKPVHCEVLFRSLDRPEDVRKLLSLELTGAYINEAREVSQQAFEVLQQRVDRYPPHAKGGPTWAGIWLDTNPWHTGHWGYRLFTKRENLKPEEQHLFVLFEQPGGRTPEAENLENLKAGYYERLCAGKDADWIKSYVDGKYPSSDVGSILGPLVAALEGRGGLAEFKPPTDGVFTNWDLGVSDSTAIWFWRVNEHRVPDIIDHYEASGQPASHYFNEIERRGYKYVKHWLPHDARQRSWQTGVGVVDQFIARFGAGAVAIGPEMSLRDGIAASRWLLEQPIRIHPRCQAGIDALREYRYEFDEELRVFSTRPLHNWASHTADAFRGLALVVRHTDVITRKPPPPEELIAVINRRPTLDELWADAPAARPGRI